MDVGCSTNFNFYDIAQYDPFRYMTGGMLPKPSVFILQPPSLTHVSSVMNNPQPVRSSMVTWMELANAHLLIDLTHCRSPNDDRLGRPAADVLVCIPEERARKEPSLKLIINSAT